MLSAKHKILIIDSNLQDLEKTKSGFSSGDFEVHIALICKEITALASALKPHLILLELQMPEVDGIDVCTYIKRTPELNNTQVVFYTLRNDDYSQIAAFNAGADDYITKPQNPRVLKSRITALLKRYNGLRPTKQKTSTADNLFIDKEKYLIIKKGERIVLPRKEFELLAFLANTPKKVFSRKEISNFIWGADIEENSRTIDVHIRRIRKKIGENYIETVKGIGYRLHI